MSVGMAAVRHMERCIQDQTEDVLLFPQQLLPIKSSLNINEYKPNSEDESSVHVDCACHECHIHLFILRRY